MREVSADQSISLETITGPQEKMGEIGSREALVLPVHVPGLRLLSASCEAKRRLAHFAVK
jgi:hypothetical protein